MTGELATIGLLGMMAGLLAISIWGFQFASRFMRDWPGMQARLEGRIDLLEAEIDDLRAGRSTDHEEIRDLRDGIVRLVNQLRAAGLVPEWTPEEVVRRPRAGQSALAVKLGQLFDVQELNGLAFDMGLAADELAGETREARARALVTWAADRGRLAEIRQRVETLRPGTKWR